MCVADLHSDSFFCVAVLISSPITFAPFDYATFEFIEAIKQFDLHLPYKQNAYEHDENIYSAKAKKIKNCMTNLHSHNLI